MKRVLLLFMLLVVTLTYGCSDQEKEQDRSKERIISLMPSNTEILFALGLEKQIIGVTTMDDYPAAAEDKAQFDGMNLNYEKLLKAKPTMIFTHASTALNQEKTLKKLKDKGVEIVVVKDAKKLSEVDDSIAQIAQATDKRKEGQQLIDEIDNKISEVKKKYKNKVDGKRVFIEVSSKPDIYTGGNGTLFDNMLTVLGAENVYKDINGWKPVTPESVIEKNPDVMISTSGTTTKKYYDDVYNRAGFYGINAVQTEAVYAIDDDKVSRPGPRIGEGLELLAKAIANEE